MNPGRCTACGAEVAEDASFCTGCGTPIEAGAASRCPLCGAEITEGASFCTNCGVPVKIGAVAARIEQVLTSCGFRRTGVGSSDFDAAFVRRGLLVHLGFLVKDLKKDSADANSVQGVVKAGRKWYAKNALRLLEGAVLNLILLHQGQLSAADIKGQVDRTGLHFAVVQSITAIDVRNGSVVQEQTRIKVGRVKEALRLLAGVTSA